ncbi:MAG: CoA transferase, partial [Candidatus Eremiobacteraeota bacterium]|nr:CoA transferase [Candidatus Eremiobacteraeota bacterium]
MPSEPSAQAGPLAGIRVVDLTTVVAGPYTTRILADYGADVIKVEPSAGDIMRWQGPGRHVGMGAIFLHLNRGKRSVVLDLKDERERAALLKLCERADLFMHNIRPAAMERLRLGYAQIAAVNPAIVYAALVGYDQRGPYASRAAYDDLIQGASGIGSLLAQTGDGVPRYVPVNMADRISGITAVGTVLAALLARERTGRGQAVEIPMFETLVDFVMGDHLGGHTFEPALGGFGYGRLLTPLRRPHRTKDGYVCVLLYDDRQWERFFALAGRSEQYAGDARLNDMLLRREHYHEAYEIVAEILATRSTAEWLAAFREHDIPAMPLHDMESLLHDPHLGATGFFREQEHPTEGA